MLQYSQGSLHVGGLRMLYGSNEVASLIFANYC